MQFDKLKEMLKRGQIKEEISKGEVLIDGWTLLSVFYQIAEFKVNARDRLSECYGDHFIDQIAEFKENAHDDISKLCMGYFTTAIILWDKLSYLIGGTFPESLDEYLPDNELGIRLKKLLSSEYHDLNFNSFFDSLETLYNDGTERELPVYFGLERSKLYLEISNELGVNYLPHPLRAEYMEKNELHGHDFERIRLMENLDNTLKEFYDEINKKYNKGIFYVKYPLLYDYIRKNCNTPADELNAALELRNDKSVIEFRKSLNNLHDMINSGNVDALDTALKQLKELSETITRTRKGARIPEMSVGLSIPPIRPSISIKLPSLNLSDKKIINMTFLTRLADYAVTERIDRGYRRDIYIKKAYRNDIYMKEIKELFDTYLRQLMANSNK